MSTSTTSVGQNSPRPKTNPLQWEQNTNLYIPFSAGRPSVSVSESHQAGTTLSRYQRSPSSHTSKKCLVGCVATVGLALIVLGAYSASNFEKGSRDYTNFVTIAVCGGIVITSLCLAAICKRYC